MRVVSVPVDSKAATSGDTGGCIRVANLAKARESKEIRMTWGSRSGAVSVTASVYVFGRARSESLDLVEETRALFCSDPVKSKVNSRVLGTSRKEVRSTERVTC